MAQPTTATGRPTTYDELKWVRPPPSGNDGHYIPYKAPESLAEKIKRKTKANPYVPIGVLATTAALTFGLLAMKNGNVAMSQNMMRARVTAQGFTVGALVLGVLLAGAQAR